MKTNLCSTDKGFTFIEVLIVVAIIGVLAAIGIPQYLGYITNAKICMAKGVMEPLPVLIETYRAENGVMCPACSANGVYTYSYTENDDGTVLVDTITPNFPGFRAKSEASTNAVLYHYQVVFYINQPAPSPCPGEICAQTIASPVAGRDAPAGEIKSNAIK